ncbi:phosphoribosylglycinamide formyltransferase [Aquamicrobium ahrensii]|uniref:Phosphoribosylglycinamide formyltransferase n=1 Tax=Aquamicrobium ahrensii TaxID=469551 RepID=A0ABV2KG63_9HYPH
MTIQRKRTVVLISGRGSNMGALIEAASDPAYPAEIVGVISDNADAQGLRVAAARGIPTRTVLRSDYASKAQHDAAIDAALGGFKAEIVALAGYMRLLTASFVEKWLGRMINIHPSLLPSFKGLEPHRRALEAGVKVHGCTVHFVTAEMDDGPIIAQAAVPVLAEDDEASLIARVLRAEHPLYVLALKMLAEGKVAMTDGKVRFSSGPGLVEKPESLLMSPADLREEVDLEALARFTP